MNKSRKILILMIIIVLMIITIVIALLIINKYRIIKEDNVDTIAFEDLEKIQNKNLFYKINDNINRYFNYIFLDNLVAVEAISQNEPIKISKEYNNLEFQSQEMYVLDKISNITVYIYGIIRNNDEQDNYYLVANLDYSNNTFSIINSSIEEYSNASKNIINNKYKQDIVIPKNQYNQLEEVDTTDFDILKIYFEDYKYKVKNNIEEAFKLLDITYKEKKFNNSISEYTKYIEDNIDKLVDANIVKHGINRNGQYVEYIAIDNYNNYYKFNEIGINKYTIILDNYTLETDELKDKYNKLSKNEKVLSNIDRIFKLINTKDYIALYSYANQEFKNNYFKTQESFNQYIQDNFFDNNIVGAINISNQGDIYIAKVPYKESLSSAAEEKEITFIIKLKEGTDFELSFNVE